MADEYFAIQSLTGFLLKKPINGPFNAKIHWTKELDERHLYTNKLTCTMQARVTTGWGAIAVVEVHLVPQPDKWEITLKGTK